jgi:hypothetical protein
MCIDIVSHEQIWSCPAPRSVCIMFIPIQDFGSVWISFEENFHCTFSFARVNLFLSKMHRRMSWHSRSAVQNICGSCGLHSTQSIIIREDSVHEPQTRLGHGPQPRKIETGGETMLLHIYLFFYLRKIKEKMVTFAYSWRSPSYFCPYTTTIYLFRSSLNVHLP